MSQVAGWRTVYVAAAVLMLARRCVLYVKLPRYRQSAGLRYPALLASVLDIARGEPVLRRRALYGVVLVRHVQRAVDDAGLPARGPALRLQRRHHRSLRARRRGRRAHRVGRRPLHRPRLGLLAHRRVRRPACSPASCFLWFGGQSLAALLVGILLLDVGSQGVHISNQSEIYRLRPEARNRINAFYMTTCFVGAAAGSAAAAFAYDHWGWLGTCVLGGLVSVAAVARWATDRAAAPRREGTLPRGPASRMTRKDQA